MLLAKLSNQNPVMINFNPKTNSLILTIKTAWGKEESASHKSQSSCSNLSVLTPEVIWEWANNEISKEKHGCVVAQGW